MQPATPPEIVVEGVYKRFDHAALQDVSLTIRRGELVALVGLGGSGKTVFLKLLTGHFRPDRGRVLIADHESEGAPLRDPATLSESQVDRLRRHWSLVFQGNAPLSGTVYENLAVFPRELKGQCEGELLPLARRVLEDVGLEPAAVLDEDCATLSAGAAKQVAIARALMMDPVLVMYDSPTAGLGPESAWRIGELIAATHARRPALGVARTTLLVTQDTELLRLLRPRIVMLHEGRVVFDGSFESFQARQDPLVRPYLQRMSLPNTPLRADSSGPGEEPSAGG